MRVFSLSFLFISLNVWAEAGLYRPLDSRLNLAIGIQEQVVEKSFKAYLGEGAYRCSGQFISKQGHFLTALHCLSSNPNLLRTLGIEERIDENLYYWQVRVKYPQNAFIPQVTLRDHLGRDFFSGRAQVVAMGAGMTTARPVPFQGEIEISNELQNIYAQFDGDYIIIKLPIETSRLCLVGSSSAIIEREALWGIGHPAKTMREDFANSDGESLFITQGMADLSMQHNGFGNILDPEDFDRYYACYMTPNRRVVDMDAFSHMSGGMVINNQGELAGIIVGTQSNKYMYRSSSTEIQSYMAVRSLVQEEAGFIALDTFQCL